MSFPDKVKEISIRIASDYEDWEFKTSQFKNRSLKHTTLLVDPFWTFKLRSFSPIYGLYNLRIEKIWSQSTGKPKSPIGTFWDHIRDSDSKKMRVSLFNSENPLEEAEKELRRTLELGIQLINSTYDLTSEDSLFKNLPKFWENKFYNDDTCTRYFIAKKILGDQTEANDYLNEKIKTTRPKRKHDLEKVLASI